MARNRKKTIERVKIVDIADKGMSFGKTEDGMTILVEGTVPGDVVDVLTLRKKKGLWFSVPKHYHSKSEDRVEPVCQHFGVCGGCKWQHQEEG